MAQIEQSDKGGKKKKGAQKKFSVHVDFTPMVDMNMLLLTFFMLCTTMLKSQTLQVTLPSNIKSEQNQQKVAESNSLTMVLDTEDGKNYIYFYKGAVKFTETGEVDPAQAQPVVSREEFLGNNEEGGYQGIRAILYENNKDLMDQYLELKAQWKNGGFGEGEAGRTAFEDAAKALRLNEDITQLNVLVKPMSTASYECVIGALDELQINQISRYRIQLPNAADSVLMQRAFPNKVIQL